MNILVIGSGGREHALVWKLAQSPQVTRLWCAPGNAGIAAERCLVSGAPVECVEIGADDLPALLAFAIERQPRLTVVGPDNPLGLGIVDLFRAKGLRIWGPDRRAARFEASKVFTQQFMERHGIPAARGGTFDDPAAAKRFAATLAGHCAVKADGLALGKGVLLVDSCEDAARAIDEIMVRRAFGAAGERVVVQEFLEGTEISLHALCDGRSVKLFPTSQDHKRARDGDQGPNTGGMGACSPAPFLSEAALAQVARSILDPWLKGCADEGIDFRGVLYPGVMLTREGPKVLEFNVRFGDPEAQVYLTRLETDLVELLDACLDGTLGRRVLAWSPEASICVVMAAAGYPGNPARGDVIHGLEDAARLPKTRIFHAGTALRDRQVVTRGGRVLGVTAWSTTLATAREAAYAAVSHIQFQGAQYRRDIGAKALAADQAT